MSKLPVRELKERTEKEKVSVALDSLIAKKNKEKYQNNRKRIALRSELAYINSLTQY